MARVVNSTVTPFVKLNLHIHTATGVIDKQLSVDDMVENLRYVSNKTVAKASGRVAAITYKIAKSKRFYTNLAKLRSYFKFDVIPVNVVVDCSEVNHSNLIEVPVKEILEDEGVTDVKRISYDLSYGFDDVVEMSDGVSNAFRIQEGQIVNNLVYMYKGGESTVESARVIAIRPSSGTITPAMLEMNMDGKLKEVSVASIISVGSVEDPITTNEALGAAVEKGGVIQLDAGTFGGIIATQSITLCGNKAGSPAAGSTMRDKNTFIDETVLTEGIQGSAGVNIVLDGVVLTKAALIRMDGAGSVELKNCIVTGLDDGKDRALFCHLTNGEPVKMNVEGCFFGSSYRNGKESIYNMFELDAKLMDGSTFCNNYFKEGCQGHNTINIYGVEDNAVITIANNIWEYSGNGILIGTKGSPKCTINIERNEYKSTDMSDGGAYAGLMLIQSYLKETISWSGVTINLNRNVHKDTEGLYYVCNNSKCTTIDADNVPVVKINGIPDNPLSNIVQ